MTTKKSGNPLDDQLGWGSLSTMNGKYKVAAYSLPDTRFALLTAYVVFFFYGGIFCGSLRKAPRIFESPTKL